MTDDLIKELLKTEKTPLYVFDVPELKRRVQYLRDRLPSGTELCYAVKANSFIVREISEVIGNLEICSPGEYRICKKLGIPSGRYVISGVNKDPDFIAGVVKSDEFCRTFTAESAGQFDMLRNTAERCNRVLSVMLRLSCGNQFGMDRRTLTDIIVNYKNDPWINIDGIQYFTGTQKKSLKKLQREINLIDTLIANLYDFFSFRVKKFEYGPGFPVAYFKDELHDEEEFLKSFSDMLEGMRYKGPVALEVGRGIAASCGTYLTSIVDTKKSDSEYFAIVDGGMNHIVYYGQSMALKHPLMHVYPQRDTNGGQEWNICGSLCTANDFLVKRFPADGLCKGDVIAFENAGAYCATEGMAFFLSRDIPAIVMRDESGAFYKVRDHMETDVFNTPVITE